MLKALVIAPNEKTVEYGSLLAVVRAEARKREHSDVNPPIRALVFVAKVGCTWRFMKRRRLPDG